MSEENTSTPVDQEDADDTAPKTKKGNKGRIGKTARDHKSGAWKQRHVNLADRAAWIAETRPKVYTTTDSVPRMPKPHGLGNSSKRFKIKPGRLSKG